MSLSTQKTLGTPLNQNWILFFIFFRIRMGSFSSICILFFNLYRHQVTSLRKGFEAFLSKEAGALRSVPFASRS